MADLEIISNYCEEYKLKNWVLEKELVKYCENDTVALYQIITKFAKEVFNLYSLDITKYPTPPSTTMGVYRIHYLPTNTVPLIGSRLHFTLKQAYYGGMTDTYRPRGENILSYCWVVSGRCGVSSASSRVSVESQPLYVHQS